MGVVIEVFLLVFNILNVIIHSLASYLLICLYQNGDQNVQQLYLINLSVSEALANFLGIFTSSLTESIAFSESTASIVEEVQSYIWIIVYTMIYLLYYMSMIYITTDRLLDILLNLKYPVYCDEFKAKCLLITTWILGIILCLVVVLLHTFKDWDCEDAFFKYFYPTVDFLFLIIAMFTYVFIFKKYMRAQEAPSQIERGGSKRHGLGAFKIFCKSRFFIVVLLISSFILFIIVPDMILLSNTIKENKFSSTVLSACFISYAISDFIDGILYVFIQPSVRKLLKKKLHIGSNIVSNVNTGDGQQPTNDCQ